MRFRRIPHTECRIYRGCPACRRSADAVEMAAGTFGLLVVLTVCPVTVLLAMAGRAVAGTSGLWTVVAFLLALPGLVALWCWLHPDEKKD